MNRPNTVSAGLQERTEGALIPFALGAKTPVKTSTATIELLAEAQVDAVEIAIRARYSWMEGKVIQIHQWETIEQVRSYIAAFQDVTRMRGKR